MSELFVRTLREDPADAEVPSHRWLVRAGYIRRAAPGIYSWLPLGYRVLRNVERIVREEMDAIGAQEVHFPALLPKEPYEASGRWTDYGESIFRLRDRKGAEYLLGPTHEEMFTLLVKDLYSSYKDLPLSLYQIQTKYRDEARPRAGLLRGREFVMKDSYSFDIDDEGLAKSYAAHRDAYIKIFNRLGFEYVIVHAMSGAMGGSASEEFLAIAENGEDTFVRSPGVIHPSRWAAGASRGSLGHVCLFEASSSFHRTCSTTATIVDAAHQAVLDTVKDHNHPCCRPRNRARLLRLLPRRVNPVADDPGARTRVGGRGDRRRW